MIKKHIIQLDGLRFYAVAMVMIAHWLQWQWSNPVLLRLPFVHGVTLFFVLSGFLITRILLQSRERLANGAWTTRKALGVFYGRRSLRIFPIYYATLLVLFCINYDNTRQLWPWLVAFASNIYQSIHNVYIGQFNHFWSLAVEEQFYLLWPFLILGAQPKRTGPLILIVIAASLLIKGYFYFCIGKWMATSYFTLCCMNALGVGGYLAYLKWSNSPLLSEWQKPKYLYSTCSIYLLLLLISSVAEWGWYKEIFDEFAFAVCAFFLVLRASTNGFKGFAGFLLSNKLVVTSGKISYGLYVFHLFVPVLWCYLVGDSLLVSSNKYVNFCIHYFITFILAWVSWHTIEKPIVRLKERWLPDETKT